jgi:hypothetical protein
MLTAAKGRDRTILAQQTGVSPDHYGVGSPMRDVAEYTLCRISQAASAETHSPAVLGALSVFTVAR